MTPFSNILVGVDLSQCRPLAPEGLSSRALHITQSAMAVAAACHARLRFFTALNLTEEALHHLDPDDRSQVKHTFKEEAHALLDHLVQEARRQGVEAEKKLALGKGWLEIIRQVGLGKHDLVIVGTRDQTGFRRLLFGNTALKLLRRCPCAVWVCKTGSKILQSNILVATDLKPGSEAILQQGFALGKLFGSQVHVLHVVEYPMDRLGWNGLPSATTTQYHQRVRHAAEAALRQQLEAIADEDAIVAYQTHLADGVGIPDEAIQHYLALLHIDLLVMGTAAHGGFLIGNTAERLLPEVHCSVLALKPPSFQAIVPA